MPLQILVPCHAVLGGLLGLPVAWLIVCHIVHSSQSTYDTLVVFAAFSGLPATGAAIFAFILLQIERATTDASACVADIKQPVRGN
jgi:hypothetical protein